MKYTVVLDGDKELSIIADDVNLEAPDDGDIAWFNFTNGENETVGAFPFSVVSYIYVKS